VIGAVGEDRFCDSVLDNGGVVFDGDETVGALEFHAELAEFTPGDAGTIGPVYDSGNAHLYSGNSFRLRFDVIASIPPFELVAWTVTDGVIVPIDRERATTYGEVVSTAAFPGKSPRGARGVTTVAGLPPRDRHRSTKGRSPAAPLPDPDRPCPSRPGAGAAGGNGRYVSVPSRADEARPPATDQTVLVPAFARVGIASPLSASKR